VTELVHKSRLQMSIRCAKTTKEWIAYLEQLPSGRYLVQHEQDLFVRWTCHHLNYYHSFSISTNILQNVLVITYATLYRCEKDTSAVASLILHY
jgi:hypothetical protein